MAKGKSSAEGYFRTSDGVELYFEDSLLASKARTRQQAGRSEPALFFIYGLGCSIHHWKNPIAYFSSGAPFGCAGKPRRIVWLDFRGHGRSQRPLPKQRLTMELVCADIKELCDHLQIQQAVFLGQSMGGSLALMMAHLYPQLTAALVLVASPGRDPAPQLPLQILSRPLWDRLQQLNDRWPLALQLGFRLGGPLTQLNPLAWFGLREVVRFFGFNAELSQTQDIEAYIRDFLRVDPQMFFDLAKDLGGFDVGDFQPAISAPALLITGARDHIVPRKESQYLLGHLPQGELHELPHGSHCPHFDDPAEVCRLIEGFLQRSR